MAKYEIEISFTRDGETQRIHGAVESASYLQALTDASAAFGEDLEQQGVDSAGSVTINIWAVDVPQGSTEVDDMPAGV